MTEQNPSPAGAHMEAELISQPEMWTRATEQSRHEALLPADGQRIAVIGCGTSWFMANSYAVLREQAGKGITDAFAASEAFVDRGYDAVLAISRSGTTTEILEVLDHLKGKVPTVAIIGDTETPATNLADRIIDLHYADEQSVVQTRFATTALAYMKSSLGYSMEQAIQDARHAITEQIDQNLIDADQFTFIGRGWTVGLAHEAALKMREASQSWTESYPAMEYRHGPIAIAGPGRVTWMFGDEPRGLAADVTRTGARYIHTDADALAELIRAQRVALARARARGLDPDQPRNLSRSVILAAH
ncbi:SIS domain-containing protein [Arthrobacter sp. KNU-44]|uniref:SIS domain-containing protein n=1 Tax=Arthrobacter sp. KNU-44 TaxID=3450744 RepID=UPI003F4348E3